VRRRSALHELSGSLEAVATYRQQVSMLATEFSFSRGLQARPNLGYVAKLATQQALGLRGRALLSYYLFVKLETSSGKKATFLPACMMAMFPPAAVLFCWAGPVCRLCCSRMPGRRSRSPNELCVKTFLWRHFDGINTIWAGRCSLTAAAAFRRWLWTAMRALHSRINCRSIPISQFMGVDDDVLSGFSREFLSSRSKQSSEAACEVRCLALMARVPVGC
jgi:hypothetical protein